MRPARVYRGRMSSETLTGARPPRRRPQWRRWIRGIALSTLVFVLALEAVLRLVPRAIPLALLEQFEPGMRTAIAAELDLTTKADTVLVPRTDGGPAERMWIYQPRARVTYAFDEPGIVETIQVDDAGFCNPAPDAYFAEHFDLIAVGDSFTFCTSVRPEDTWSSRLAALTGMSTYDLGMPGRGLYEYLQLLERYGLPKSPRIVVVNVYEGNDFRDAYLFHQARGGGPGAAEGARCPFGSERVCAAFKALGKSWLGRHSRALNLATSALWTRAAREQKREIDFQYEVRFADGSTVRMNSRNGDRDEVEFARELVAGRLRVDMFDEALARFASLAEERGFELVVLYSPSAYTAYEGMSTFSDTAIEATMRAYSAALREYFARKAEELGYAYLDLTPALQAAARGSSADDLLYFRTNVHFTAAGHRVVAEEVAKLLAELPKREAR